MAKIVWAVFCQSVITDAATNNVSIINQFDELHPAPPPVLADKKSVPTAAFQCTLLSVWERDKLDVSETVPLRIRLLGPTRKLPIVETSVDLRKTRRSRLITHLPGLPVIGEGRYRFVYEMRLGNRWKWVGEVPILVSYAQTRRAQKETTH